jgi:hypothetical protein
MDIFVINSEPPLLVLNRLMAYRAVPIHHVHCIGVAVVLTMQELARAQSLQLNPGTKNTLRQNPPQPHGQIRDPNVLTNPRPHALNLSGQIRDLVQPQLQQSNLAPQRARPPFLCNPLTDSATALS